MTLRPLMFYLEPVYEALLQSKGLTSPKRVVLEWLSLTGKKKKEGGLASSLASVSHLENGILQVGKMSEAYSSKPGPDRGVFTV